MICADGWRNKAIPRFDRWSLSYQQPHRESPGASAASRPAPVWDESPFLQQPFRYVAAITIALTPDSQLTRTAVGFLRETQAEGDTFELGCHGCRSWERLSPIRISSSFVNHGQINDHTPWLTGIRMDLIWTLGELVGLLEPPGSLAV